MQWTASKKYYVTDYSYKNNNNNNNNNYAAD